MAAVASCAICHLAVADKHRDHTEYLRCSSPECSFALRVDAHVHCMLFVAHAAQTLNCPSCGSPMTTTDLSAAHVLKILRGRMFFPDEFIMTTFFAALVYILMIVEWFASTEIAIYLCRGLGGVFCFLVCMAWAMTNMLKVCLFLQVLQILLKNVKPSHLPATKLSWRVPTLCAQFILWCVLDGFQGPLLHAICQILGIPIGYIIGWINWRADVRCYLSLRYNYAAVIYVALQEADIEIQNLTAERAGCRDADARAKLDERSAAAAAARAELDRRHRQWIPHPPFPALD